MYESFYGIGGIIILILDVLAIVNVINCGKDIGTKVLWVLLILFLPLIGLIAWLLAGPRG